MNNNLIRPLPHVAKEPLRIEREMDGGREMIVIEGVRYDAEYFRTFAVPETDVLYAVRRDEDYVVLTVIRDVEEAKEFFDTPSAAIAAPPPNEKHHLEEEITYEGVDDGL